MKKVLLFLFLIASMIVSSETLVANSLSPPKSDAKFVPQQTMLQSLSAETPQLSAVLFECDVSYSWFESSQLVITRRISVPCAMGFQELINQNNASVSLSGKTDIQKNEAISPACRTVNNSDLYQGLITRNAADQIEAISPKCRTVLSSYVISSKTCLIAAISPACRDVLLIG